MLSPQIRGGAIWWMRTKAKGRHGVVWRLNCVIHVWAPWGRVTCHLWRYINPRTFTFTFMAYYSVQLWSVINLRPIGLFDKCPDLTHSRRCYPANNVRYKSVSVACTSKSLSLIINNENRSTIMRMAISPKISHFAQHYVYNTLNKW